MARLRFRPGMRYLHQQQVYRVVQLLVSGQLLVENQSFGGQFTKSYDELARAWESGELVFEIPGQVQVNSQKLLSTSYTFPDFSGIAEELREEAWRRYQILLPLLKQPEEQRCRAGIQAYAATLRAEQQEKRRGRGTALSASSIERWLRAFERSSYDIRALVPTVHKSARKGEYRLDSELEAVIQEVLGNCATHRRQRTSQDIYLMIVNRVAEANRTRLANDQLKQPSFLTIYRRIQAKDPLILQRRRSKLEAQADASVLDGPEVFRILERVEIDHTVLDIFIVDEEDRLLIGRPTLTYALDVYSGMPFGIYVGFEPPSYRTVAHCLLQGILPKPDVCSLYDTVNPWPVYGLPETLIVDNGKEFVGRDLEDACGQLGIILERMPIRTPWFKASVERFFKTNNTGLIHMLPGTTFSNVLDQGDYDAMKHACISLTAFWKILHIFLLDVYAQQWNTGKKAIPFKRWNENVQEGFVPSLHTSAHETRILLLRTEQRAVQRGGVEFECLYYRSPALARLRSLLPATNRTVKIKYDPGNLGCIYVFDTTQGCWLELPAADQAYTEGLSLWKHRIIRRFVQAEKREVNIEALAAAKHKIQQIVTDEYMHTRRDRGRKTAARLLDLNVSPNKPEAKTPPGQPKHEGLANVANPQMEDQAHLAALLDSQHDPSVDDSSGWGGDYNLPNWKREDRD